MKRRIAIWACAGFLVACFWTAYSFATAPDYETSLTASERVIRGIAYLTCPTLLTGLYFYWLLLGNTLTYALIGLGVEAMRRKLFSRK
jgi:hypothetical protein